LKISYHDTTNTQPQTLQQTQLGHKLLLLLPPIIYTQSKICEYQYTPSCMSSSSLWENTLSHWSMGVYMSMLIGWMKGQSVHNCGGGIFSHASHNTWLSPFDIPQKPDSAHSQTITDSVSRSEFALPRACVLRKWALKINLMEVCYEYVNWL